MTQTQCLKTSPSSWPVVDWNDPNVTLKIIVDYKSRSSFNYPHNNQSIDSIDRCHEQNTGSHALHTALPSVLCPLITLSLAIVLSRNDLWGSELESSTPTPPPPSLYDKGYLKWCYEILTTLAFSIPGDRPLPMHCHEGWEVVQPLPPPPSHLSFTTV